MQWITRPRFRVYRFPRLAAFRAALVVALLIALASSAVAGPGRAPVTSAPPCNPASCRAKAAFAFEQLAAETRASNTAPAPHAKACPCGVGCECAAGTCPACPTVQTSAPAAPAAPAKVAYYREVWRTDARGARVRELVPVFADAPPAPLALPAGGCANGKCPLR